MTLFESLIFGVIQGVVEWLPISSEGMISLVATSFFDFDLSEAIFLSLWLHAGTFLAAVVYFWRDLVEIFHKILKPRQFLSKQGMRKTESQLIYFLIIATTVTGVIGLPLLLLVAEEVNLQGGAAMLFIGGLLCLTGILEKFSRQKRSQFRLTNSFDALIVGLAQGLAVLPGFSRSGLTSSVLLLRKFSAREALRLSFLMSIPVVFLGEIVLGFLGKIQIGFYSLVAVVVSFVFGLLTIKYLMKIAEHINFGNFCLFLGALSILAFFIHS